MARALRVEYPGARYHIMCRGNQSRDIFEHQEDVDLFIRCLGEMCVRNRTVVHAWCLMSNHYHLLLETPLGNLVDAMKWFQGTFTQRYNARHQLWGHLFQGRYKAKVVDDRDASYFRVVSEYIHLNPAEAKLVKPGALSEYPWSSYPIYLHPPSKRPDWLAVSPVLNACGIPDDSLKSRRAYAAYMDVRHQSLAMKTQDVADQAVWEHMERGWVHGSREFRLRMLDCINEGDPNALKRVDDAEQKKDLSEAAAEAVVSRCLSYFGLRREELPRMAKSAPEKRLMAGLLRHAFPVSAAWIARELSMGHYTSVSKAVSFYDQAEGAWAEKKAAISRFST